MRKLFPLFLLLVLSLTAFTQNYTVLGNAISINGCNCYQLTADAGNQGGAVFQNHTINLNNSFDYTFNVFFGCGNGGGADGVVFVLTTNPNGLGAVGEYLGYGDGSNQPCSFAVEFDTYQNTNHGDPPYNHMAFESGGSVDHNVLGPVPANANQSPIDDCAWHKVRIVWDVTTSTYSAYLDGNLRLSLVIPNIINSYFCGNSTVNWGWTGATGGDENLQQVCMSNITSWVAAIDYESCSDTIQFTDVSTGDTNNIRSWAWTFGDGATLTGLNHDPVHIYAGPGVYNASCVITDVSGCADTFSHTVTIVPPINLTPTITNPPCNPGSNGSISVVPANGFGISGGYGGYKLHWSNNAVGDTDLGLTAGTYDVTVTDGVCTSTAQYTVNQPPPLSATISSTAASCNLSNGQVTATLSGGTPSYKDTLFEVNFYGTTNGPVSIPNVPAGTYNFSFHDANGCSALLSYSVTVASLPCGYTETASSTNVTCFGGNNGSVTLNETGGVAPVTITWKNSGGTVVGNSATVAGLPAGTYTYIFQDATHTTALGNAFTGTVTVNQPGAAMVASLATLNNSCGNTTDGQAIASVLSGGTAPFSYHWSGGQPDNPTAANLGPGVISVTVTDANGCTATATGTVTSPPALQIGVTTVNDACSQYSTGSAAANVTGGTPPYSYYWNNISTGQTDFSLAGGTYTVTATDSLGCTITGSGSVSQSPPLVVTVDSTNIACNGAANGSITVNASGGTPPYNYVWSSDTLGDVNPGLTGPNLTGLAGGEYLLTMTDAQGCNFYDSTFIQQPDSALMVTTSTTNVTCFGASNGTLTITVSGGTAPYHFGPFPIPPGTTTVPGLPDTTLAGVVQDANGCSVNVSGTITSPGPQSLTMTSTNDICFGAMTATAGANFVNATGNVTYDWSNNGTGANLTNLPAGTFVVTATDANNCVLTDSVTVTQPAAVAMTATAVNAVCFGGNGSATANPVGGNPPFTYAWSSGGATTVTVSLPAGSYTVTASDANSCGQTAAFTISQPPAINLTAVLSNINCFNGTTGSITLTVAGGTSPYTYTWNPNVSTTNVASSLAAGAYNITVTDAASCTLDTVFTLTQPPALSLTATATPASCAGQSNGSIKVTANGGMPAYTYTASDGGAPISSTTGQFNNLDSNTYVIVVTDNNQCADTTTATVGSPAPLTDIIVETPPTCYRYSNGTVTVTTLGGTPAYQYAFSTNTSNSSGVLSFLPAGTYTVTITDANNCTLTDSTTLAQPDSILIEVTPATGQVQLGDTLQLNTNTNQSGTITYAWTPNYGLSCYDCPDPVFNGVNNTPYYVTATTQDSCTATAMFTVTVIPNYGVFFPNVFSPNGDGKNDYWQMFTSTPDIKQLYVAVFDRIGEKVFESNDINFAWDGSYKGHPAPEGVYVYMAKIVWLDDRSTDQIKGSITLLR